MALFIALIPCTDPLQDLVRALTSLGFEPPPMHHITIVFLGDVSGAHMHKLLARLEGIDIEIPRAVRVVDVDALPPHKMTNIVLKLESSELTKLREKLLKALRIELRDAFAEYVPHLTVARARRPPPQEVVEKALRIVKTLVEEHGIRILKIQTLVAIESRGGKYRVVKELQRADESR